MSNEELTRAQLFIGAIKVHEEIKKIDPMYPFWLVLLDIETYLKSGKWSVSYTNVSREVPAETFV